MSGRVQGVGFRFFVQRAANSLGLSGWVRNRGSDQVEVLAEGSEEALHQLLGYLRRGPSGAYVAKVAVDWSEARGDLPTPFAIMPSVWQASRE